MIYSRNQPSIHSQIFTLTKRTTFHDIVEPEFARPYARESAPNLKRTGLKPWLGTEILLPALAHLFFEFLVGGCVLPDKPDIGIWSRIRNLR